MLRVGLGGAAAGAGRLDSRGGRPAAAGAVETALRGAAGPWGSTPGCGMGGAEAGAG